MRPVAGDVIGGKYRVVRVIGDGGMGTVYEARHEVLGTAVALKFLHAELARRAGLAQRFLQEARVSANIQSIHVTRASCRKRCARPARRASSACKNLRATAVPSTSWRAS